MHLSIYNRECVCVCVCVKSNQPMNQSANQLCLNFKLDGNGYINPLYPFHSVHSHFYFQSIQLLRHFFTTNFHLDFGGETSKKERDRRVGRTMNVNAEM